MNYNTDFKAELGTAVNGKRILITGASSGVGLAMAQQLAPTGARLILVARSEDKLIEAQNEVARRGGHAEIYTCDLSKDEDTLALTESVNQDLGGVDILINNAGRSIRRPVTESTDRLHDYRRTMELNYFGSIRLILAFLPGMEARNEGHILNILTMGCQVRTPKFSAYIASKLALDAASRCMAAELKDQNIKMTQVYLPLVRTPMISPTDLYNNVTAMHVDSAAERTLQALITGQPRVMMPLGIIAELVHLWAPDYAQTLLNKLENMEPKPASTTAAKLGEKLLNLLAYGTKQSEGA